ncbi:MAG: hypothetical protein ACOYL3_11250 [Desulfuromonadaceae bacterium]
MKKVLLIFVVLVTCMVATLIHAAPSEMPVLPAGVLYGLAGEPLLPEALGREKGVILLLLKNGGSSGDKLLTFVEGLKPPLPADRLLIAVGNADETLLKAIAHRHANLAASWYRDTDDLLAKGLTLKANPAIMGVRDGRAVWTSFGLADRKLLEKTMRGWLNR